MHHITIKRLQLFWAVSAVFVFTFLFGAATDSFAFVRLSVQNATGHQRVDEPLTSGVPLPESMGIASVGDLVVTDEAGTPIPAQFTVLSRWNGTPSDDAKPIKWVLVNFQADAPRNGSGTYYLKERSEAGAPPSNAGMSVIETGDGFTVDTGKAKYAISKRHFNVFDHVWIDGNNDGQLDDPVLSQPGEGGIVLTDRSGKEYRALFEAPEEIAIEEQGPFKTIIRIRGVLKSADGTYFAPSVHRSGGYSSFDQPYPHSFVYYNCRIHFYNDTDYVKFFFTLENNGANGRTNPEQGYAPVQMVYFDSLYVVLKPNSDASVNIHSEDSSATLSAADRFTLYQNWREDVSDNSIDTLEPSFDDGIHYTASKNGDLISQGQTNPGWIDINDGQKGIGLAIRHFWQNFPKKNIVTKDEIRVGLWPEEGYYPYCDASDFSSSTYAAYCREAGRTGGAYLLDGGRHKTYEMALRFYTGGQDGKTAELANALDHPLMAIAPPEWYAQSRALGMMAPAGLSSTDPELNVALSRFDQLQVAVVDPASSENGATALNLKTSNPPNNEFSMQNRFFNWMNFGDLLWSGQQPSALHYDWPYSMLLHYLRTGDERFFDAGVAMAKHRYDVDQYHGERTSTSGSHKWINHMAFYESDGHCDPTLNPSKPSRISLNSHTWNGGLVLYYLLTGDRKAWEAAVENGQAALNHYGSQGLRDADRPSPARQETRMETWPMLNLIHLYRVSGNDEYLRVATNIAKNRLITREQMAGGNGYFGWGDGSSISDSVQPSVMYAYAVEPIVAIYQETRDKDIGDLIVRMADFTKDSFLFGGKLNSQGQYMPLQCTYIWRQSDPDGSQSGEVGEPIKTAFFADLFAAAYQITGEDVYLDWARKCFRDTAFYYAVGGSQYLSPSYRSLISYRDRMFPGSRTKIHGWLGRTNQVYLYTEWQLQNNGQTPNVSKPVFSPSPGTYQESVAVSIQCATSDATIRYALDGKDPTWASPVYVTPLSISETTTLRAAAYDASGTVSLIASGTYLIEEEMQKLSLPVFSPEPGTYDAVQEVRITHPTPNVVIRYSLDGSAPQEYDGPIVISSSATLRAQATKTGWVTSGETVGEYVIDAPSVDIPVFSPAPAVFQEPISLSIQCNDPDAVIRYTLDGSMPTDASTRYNDPVVITKTTTIKAAMFDAAGTAGPVISGTFTIQDSNTLGLPYFTPKSGSYATAQQVRIQHETPDVVIYYTLGDSEPRMYAKPLTVSTSATLKAKAFKYGWTPSDVAEGEYVIATSMPKPAFSPTPGKYKREQSVIISCGTEGAVIHYTTDGSEPTETSPVCDSPILISSSNTIKARSYLPGTDPSATATGEFQIVQAGDINGDDVVDLYDAIVGLQIAAGIIPAAPIEILADVDNDDRIGIVDGMSALRRSSSHP